MSRYSEITSDQGLVVNKYSRHFLFTNIFSYIICMSCLDFAVRVCSCAPVFTVFGKFQVHCLCVRGPLCVHMEDLPRLCQVLFSQARQEWLLGRYQGTQCCRDSCSVRTQSCSANAGWLASWETGNATVFYKNVHQFRWVDRYVDRQTDKPVKI